MFWSNCLGFVAYCSLFVQGVKLQLSLCHFVGGGGGGGGGWCKAVLFFLSRGGYNDSIILSRDARINIICPGCK